MEIELIIKLLQKAIDGDLDYYEKEKVLSILRNIQYTLVDIIDVCESIKKENDSV